MKKSFLLFLFMLTAFALVACGQKEVPDPGNGDPEDPTFSGIVNESIAWGSTFEPLDGVTASAYDGADLTASIEVTGTVDVLRGQSYTLTYTVTDAGGRTATQVRTIQVEFPTFQDFINVTENDTLTESYEAGSNLDLSQPGSTEHGLAPHWTTWGSGGSYVIEDNVLTINTSMSYYQVANGHHEFNVGQRYIVLFDIKAAQAHEAQDVDYTFRVIVGSEEAGWDDYHIQYFPNNVIGTEYETFAFLFTAQYNTKNVLAFISNNKANTIDITNIQIFEVEPKEAAEITGNEPITIEWNSVFDPFEGLSAIDVVDGDISELLEVDKAIDTYFPGTYLLRYSVTNAAGVETIVTRLVTVGQPTQSQLASLAAGEGVLPYAENNLDLTVPGDSSVAPVQGWNSWGMGGPFIIEDLTMTIQTDLLYFQVANGSNNLNEGNAYIVKFDIKALHEQTGVFRAIVGSEATGWDDYHIQYFDETVGNEYQTFYFMFGAKYATHNVLLFAFEHQENTYTIRNIEIIDLDPPVGPEITGNEPLSITWADGDVNLLEGITAIDEIDGDVSDLVTYEGLLDVLIPGVYTITYEVTNSAGATTVFTREITVEEPTTAALIAMQNDDTVTTPYVGNNLDFSLDGHSDDEGVAGWGSWGLGGPFSVEEGVMTIVTGGTYFQVSNSGNTFEEEAIYIVTFDIKATENHTGAFRAIVGSEKNGWHDFHIQYFEEDVSTEYQTFAFYFIAEYDTHNVLLFAADLVPNTFMMTNLNVVKIDR